MNYQTIKLQPYNEQLKQWPDKGQHILAQYDDESIIVYQAYRPEIGHFAAKNGYFGGEFSLSRMSWIKPNFLWMMYRCGWATKPGQEVVLAVRLKRRFFDSVLAQAIPSSFNPDLHSTRQEWAHAVKQSNVRLQWDPDHDPVGHKVTRRAVQLGLRNDAIAEYARAAIIEIIDATQLVAQQRIYMQAGDYELLATPEERVYLPDGTNTDRV